jgi:sugar phosphate isomerase/epimerase
MISTLNPVTAGGGLPFAEYVALAARSGFQAVDFDISAAHQLGLQAAAEVLESNGILPGAIGLPVEWRKDEASYRAGLQNLPELAKFAQDLGCRRCCTWVLPDGGMARDQYRKISLGRFIEISRILVENGVRFGLEFIGPHHFRTQPESGRFGSRRRNQFALAIQTRRAFGRLLSLAHRREFNDGSGLDSAGADHPRSCE